MQNLKEANRRLKESNERLIGENTRLEEELAALQRKAGEPSLEPPALAMKAQDPPRTQGKPDPDLLLDDDDVQVDRTSQGLRFRIPDRVFFALGQATISARGQKILDKVSRIINADFPGHLVRVDGHTDDTPIRKVRSQFPTNWELSSARACTVVRYLVDKGNVNAHRIFPAGFSYYRPVATGRSPNAKSQNRRVEITIMNESA
jgi:flagellar motor protein MotB